ncbi:hypothetical protein [Belliella aquatica]|uniref:Secreted protein n=1 Tax=Belliella aquatica TaxID=1323734 RepID=A0ABQ1LYW0_9BACT|nr:hypothetical protein [Belliella aquatica]MCH7407291.1 hypothetical protein [Belliella aquatica]GGC31501.1 hypothetical protein GCM10010993_08070 [Belliella aquatica]
MNKLMKYVPVLVFVIVAVFAFAFTQPTDPLQAKYGFFGNEWYDATNATEGVDYQCDLLIEEVCTRSAPNQGASIVENGQFIPVTLSPMED